MKCQLFKCERDSRHRGPHTTIPSLAAKWDHEDHGQHLDAIVWPAHRIHRADRLLGPAADMNTQIARWCCLRCGLALSLCPVNAKAFLCDETLEWYVPITQPLPAFIGDLLKP